MRDSLFPRAGMKRARAWLDALKAIPLVLQVAQQEYSFRTLQDFEFAAAGRTAIPLEKFTDMIRLPAPELRHEANGIRQVERQFIAVLEKCMEEPENTGALIRDLGIKAFSKDHEWRDILASLNPLGPEFDEFKKVALVKYLQYLGSRQELLNMLYQARTSEPFSDQEELLEEAVEQRGIGTKDTVIFDLMQLEESHRFINPYERLPRGETVTLRLPKGASVEILLSKHRFKLIAGDHFALVDDAGHAYILGDGRNIVGRHLSNQINIDSAYRSVSRKHMIVELRDKETVHVTDLSSHGTFVPPEFVGAVIH